MLSEFLSPRIETRLNCYLIPSKHCRSVIFTMILLFSFCLYGEKFLKFGKRKDTVPKMRPGSSKAKLEMESRRAEDKPMKSFVDNYVTFC